MEFPALEKFIKSMGITVELKVDRTFVDSRGRRNVRIRIRAFYNGNKTYEKYNWYEFTNRGEMTFSEGDIVMGPNDGVFAYLGDKHKINQFFGDLAEKKAKNFYEEIEGHKKS